MTTIGIEFFKNIKRSFINSVKLMKYLKMFYMWYKTRSIISGIKLTLKELRKNPAASTLRKILKKQFAKSLYISYIYIRGILRNRGIKHTSPFAFLKKCSCEEAPQRRREKDLKKTLLLKRKEYNICS